MQFNLFENHRVADFYVEDMDWSGVRRIAEKVCQDVELVTGVRPGICKGIHEAADLVIVGTVGKSGIIDRLEQEGKICLEQVRGKREVYSFQLLEHPLPSVKRALVIAGSDKRGTIYGLFHLSELMGVSPLVNWCDVKPEKLDRIVWEEGVNLVSKEPSVRFRGFFINDEWPAFGNWCMKRFGGFNAKAYEHVFELLLRLKGNYLWPAMWSARFQDDGPGLLNAELADELGVVMGMSHHEPCLRQGEEYKHVRGADSIYGDAWNFRTNKEGITRFWEDGLKRSGKFENVITMGMRGEADTTILGKEATLEDNIALLKDVLAVQKRLIRENVCEDAAQVPKMIALYKEVEEFFYGNEEVKGLIGSEDLEDVILMLCDDNFGNLRTLPDDKMRSHKGGYGMYYHFDYHGAPVSYEWINSSYLPKIWEQMTTAYDFGIRELWVVNVGDICTQEFPLSYFLDLAYDFEAWGTKVINRTNAYTKQWTAAQFKGVLDEQEQEQVVEILEGYTRIVQKRRPEAMGADVYHPVHGREAEMTLKEIDRIIALAKEIYQKIPETHLPAYYALVYYPAMGTLNVHRMQILAGWNHHYAKLGALIANDYGDMVRECMELDKKLIDTYHTIDDEKWYGMGLSEHIGFTHWNSDECKNPIVMEVFPVKKSRILTMVDGTMPHTEGSSWRFQELWLKDFMEPDVSEASFSLYSISDHSVAYTITSDASWIQCSVMEGELDAGEHRMERVWVKIDRSRIMEDMEAKLCINTSEGMCSIRILVKAMTGEGLDLMTFIQGIGHVAMEADHFARKVQGRDGAAFQILENYGKTRSGMKVYPVTEYFTAGKDAPCLEYSFLPKEPGEYEATLYMQPSNPVTPKNQILYALQMNDGEIVVKNAISAEGSNVGTGRAWSKGVVDNIRKQTSEILCGEGVNTLRVYAVTPGFVLERIVIYPKGKAPEESYLGPMETYYTGRES